MRRTLGLRAEDEGFDDGRDGGVGPRVLEGRCPGFVGGFVVGFLPTGAFGVAFLSTMNFLSYSTVPILPLRFLISTFVSMNPLPRSTFTTSKP